jgi:hypothetical protein
MALTFGFYNSIGHDRRYNALQMSQLFDGIITDGVFMNIGTAMVVTAGSGLTVNVGIGRAWFNSTWTLNDAIYPIEASASDVLRDRIDAVVLEVDHRETTRANRIFIKEGVASTTPTKPVMEKTNEVYQYPLCYITRAAESTEITQTDIENCVGTSECPFVTGILSTVSTDELIKQWTARLDALILSKELEYDALLIQLRNALDEVFEGHVPDSVVYGEVTDTETEVAPINAGYLGGVPAAEYALVRDVADRVTIKKLWTNPNPTVSFGAQRVAIDLSGYDAVIVVHHKTDRASRPRISEFIVKGTTAELRYCVEVNAYRSVVVDDSGIDFQPAYYFKTYSVNTTTVGGQFCVPVEIYGVKGVR